MKPPPIPKDLILTTTDSIEGRKIAEYLGPITGCSTMNHGLTGAFKVSMQRGELDSFSSLTEQTQYAAQEGLLKTAKQLGADAVVGLTIDFEYNEAICHAVCYGTAVKLESA